MERNSAFRFNGDRDGKRDFRANLVSIFMDNMNPVHSRSKIFVGNI